MKDWSFQEENENVNDGCPVRRWLVKKQRDEQRLTVRTRQSEGLPQPDIIRTISTKINELKEAMTMTALSEQAVIE